MNAIKTLWASVQGSPVFMRKVNGWLTIGWIVMIPVSVALGWIHSVAYISALSLWALVSGHWSAWQAARVEVNQQDEAAEHDAHPVEERVVERLVQDTTLEPSAAAETQLAGPKGDSAGGLSGDRPGYWNWSTSQWCGSQRDA